MKHNSKYYHLTFAIKQVRDSQNQTDHDSAWHKLESEIKHVSKRCLKCDKIQTRIICSDCIKTGIKVHGARKFMVEQYGTVN